MDKEFKKIAIQLGIAIPACLFSIGHVKADTCKVAEKGLYKSDVAEVADNEVVCRLMSSVAGYNSDEMMPGHVNNHTNLGGNHSDRHSNIGHANQHTNNPNVCPHSDHHTNRPGNNQHTNVGNTRHSDYHTNHSTPDNCQ